MLIVWHALGFSLAITHCNRVEPVLSALLLCCCAVSRRTAVPSRTSSPNLFQLTCRLWLRCVCWPWCFQVRACDSSPLRPSCLFHVAALSHRMETHAISDIVSPPTSVRDTRQFSFVRVMRCPVIADLSESRCDEAVVPCHSLSQQNHVPFQSPSSRGHVWTVATHLTSCCFTVSSMTVPLVSFCHFAARHAR